MEVQLVLVGLGVVQHFHIAALHPHRQPLTRWAVPQREDLQRDRRCSGGSASTSHLLKHAPATSVSSAIPHQGQTPITWAQTELEVMPLLILIT